MKIFRGIIIGLILALSLEVYAFRTSSPPVLTDLTNPNQITQLNNFLEQIWNITNGRYTVEVRSADPTNIDNGDLWILESGSTHQLKWRAGGVTYAVTGT